MFCKYLLMFTSTMLVTVTASTSVAQGYDQTAAWGVAKIVSFADQCGYKVNQSGLDKHLAYAKLNTSAALGFITLVVNTDKNAGTKATEAECAVIRSTAKDLGVID